MTARDAVDEIQDAWAREQPDLPMESIGIITRIWRLGKMLEHRRQALLRRVGIDRGTLDLLATLRRSGPPYELTPTEIATSSLVTSGGVSQRLARAEAAGLIERRPADHDSRSVIVCLTDAGGRLVDDAVSQLLRAEQKSLTGLTADERRQLADLLRRLLQTLPAS